MKIAAYVYCADLYCPTCVVESMIAHGIAAPAARDMATEDVLSQCAEALGIDLMDEYSFDSGDFPKVVFAIALDGDEYCGGCNDEL